jgi:thioredoxin reductase
VQMSHSSVDIIIIGAGVAGLAAGYYAQINDFNALPSRTF